MDKNKVIKENLEFHINNSIKLFKNQFSFSNLLQQELDSFDTITWLPSPGFSIENIKEESKNDLIELLNDNQLHLEINNLVKELIDINEKAIQDHIASQLIDNLSNISINIPKEKKDFKLNLLFLVHNYEPEASFCGYEDANYEFKLLSGQEYLKYDYKRELFNGVGCFDYRPLLSPYLKFEEEIGEEKVDRINEALSGGAYLEEIKKLFLINGFLGIHLCLNKIQNEIRKIDIPMKEEVFIFGNEHDSEQLDIFVL